MTRKSFNQKTIWLHLGNTLLKLSTASGAAVSVEVRMRLIGEFSEKVQKKLEELALSRKSKKELTKTPNHKYWECNLNLLEEAVLEIFRHHFSSGVVSKIQSFRSMRNSLLHGNFVKLMKFLEIDGTGRQLGADGKRNILHPSEIAEAIKSIDRDGGFEKCETQAKEVATILDDFITHTDLN